MLQMMRKRYKNKVVMDMNNTLKGKDYRRIFFLYGIVYTTIPIIITEITWD